MADMNTTPAELFEKIKDVVSPIQDTCKKLKDNPLGTAAGKAQAGNVDESLTSFGEQGQQIVQAYMAANSLAVSAGPRMGGMGSASRGSTDPRDR